VVADKYRFERLLGEGAQGWVWQAHNILLDAPVAIKVVRTESADKSLPDRLFREARAAARLGHPAIVRVFDLGQARNGAPFIVMELLEGENLADRLSASGQLAPELALRLFLPIADALLAAHAKGIVHRDVKPENIFLAISGETVQPKLLDFGIAKVMQEPRRSRQRQITQTGAIVGSPAYLSPEQARGQDEIDERADVWSFCATLYECLTGELPFDGPTWRALRDDIIEGAPLSIVELGVGDEKLWQILERGLSKSKSERWPSMLALGRALACWLLERGVTADVCGVSLESRWLRCEPLAVGLFPLRLGGTEGKVLNSLGALPTGASPDSRVSELPSPASGVLFADGSLSGSIDDVLEDARQQRSFGRYRSLALAFAGALLVAVLGIAISPRLERSRTVELDAKIAPSVATVRAALPAIPALPAAPALTAVVEALPSTTLDPSASATAALDTSVDPAAPGGDLRDSPLVEVGPPTSALAPGAPNAAIPRKAGRLEKAHPAPAQPPRPKAPAPRPSSTQGLDLLDPYAL
jgi:serine/threonine-protein kinase